MIWVDIAKSQNIRAKKKKKRKEKKENDPFVTFLLSVFRKSEEKMRSGTDNIIYKIEFRIVC